MKILGAGILKKISTTVDGGWDYTIATNNGPGESSGLHLKPIVFLIQQGEEVPESFPEIAEAMKEAKVETKIPTKSKSKLLRNVLYVLWEQSTQSVTAEEFYNDRMDKITEHFKSKLE